MKKDYNKMGKADLLSLDINKMVSDINEQKTADNAEMLPEEDQKGKEMTGEGVQKHPSSTGVNASPEKSPKTTGDITFEMEESALWKSFIDNLKDTGTFAKKEERLSYWIDNDIANTLKSVDINKMSTSDIINAVLRTFITQEKESFRKFVKKREVLI